MSAVIRWPQLLILLAVAHAQDVANEDAAAVGEGEAVTDLTQAAAVDESASQVGTEPEQVASQESGGVEKKTKPKKKAGKPVSGKKGGKVDKTQQELNKVHKVVDKNKDGRAHVNELVKVALNIQKEEQDAHAKKNFQSMDASKDKKLTLDEIKASGKHGFVHMVKARDMDKKLFNAGDLNKDGLISQKEMKKMTYPEKGSKFAKAVARKKMQLHDSNGNGKLSEKEFIKMFHVPPHGPVWNSLSQQFPVYDRNSDGFLDKNELQGYIEKSSSSNEQKKETVKTVQSLFEFAGRHEKKGLSKKDLVNVYTRLKNSKKKEERGLKNMVNKLLKKIVPKGKTSKKRNEL